MFCSIKYFISLVFHKYNQYYESKVADIIVSVLKVILYLPVYTKCSLFSSKLSSFS